MSKFLGQHFLKNRSALKKIVEALDLRSGDVVVEIGAGHGELTGVLNNELRIKNNGGKVIAIEKDKNLAEGLKKKFAENKNVEIVESDALKILPSIIHDSLFIIRHYKIVGNIPYYITGKLLRILSELEHRPSLCVFALQKEVAERIFAQPKKMNSVRSLENIQRASVSGGMNRLAAIVQFWAKPEIVAYLPKTDFLPIPKVDSAVIKLESRVMSHESRFAEKYYKTVKIVFQQPRKTVLNNLADGGWLMADGAKEKIAEKLSAIGINPNDRPQNLGVEEIKKIARLNL